MNDSAAHVSRRSLLVGATSLLPLAAIPLPSAALERWTQCGLQLFRHRDSARAVGERYLASNPEGRRMVVAAIQRLEEQARRHPGHTDHALMLSALESDYRLSRIVEIDGWVLSETEVGFCVLACMSDA